MDRHLITFHVTEDTHYGSLFLNVHCIDADLKCDTQIQIDRVLFGTATEATAKGRKGETPDP
jgi:hypothetical protein